MSQLCFDRSSLIINVVFAARCSWSHCSSLRCTDASWLWLLHLMEKAAPPVSSSFTLSIYLSLYYFFSLSRSFELSRRGLTVAHICPHTHTHTHTHTGAVSPEWLWYSGWHVSLIYYWSDPAAIIYRSLRDTIVSVSLSHTHSWANLLVQSLTHLSSSS